MFLIWAPLSAKHVNLCACGKTYSRWDDNIEQKIKKEQNWARKTRIIVTRT